MIRLPSGLHAGARLARSSRRACLWGSYVARLILRYSLAGGRIPCAQLLPTEGVRQPLAMAK